jgi:hypothetical protein
MSPISRPQATVDDHDVAPIPRLSTLAAGQHGVLSVGQLKAVGVGRRPFDQLVRRGIFVRVAPGVYAAAAAPETWERKLMAGLLALGPTARISHESAASLHGLDRSLERRVEFTVDRSRRNATAIGRVHSTSRARPLDIVTFRSFRVTSATRTIVDLARARIPRPRLAALVDSAVRLGLTSPLVLHSELGFLRGPGRWGCRLLDDLLIDAGGHSMLERDFLRLMRLADLPRPRTQVIHRRGARTFARVDFLFDPYGIVVEVSGREGHSSPTEPRSTRSAGTSCRMSVAASSSTRTRTYRAGRTM